MESKLRGNWSGYEKGAQGLKTSKDLGPGVQFEDGSHVPVDTLKMDPVREECGESGLPVEIHTSDPKAFFDPFDRHNERYEEPVDNQDWMFNDPEYRKDKLPKQGKNVVEQHPTLHSSVRTWAISPKISAALRSG